VNINTLGYTRPRPFYQPRGVMQRRYDNPPDGIREYLLCVYGRLSFRELLPERLPARVVNQHHLTQVSEVERYVIQCSVVPSASSSERICYHSYAPTSLSSPRSSTRAQPLGPKSLVAGQTHVRLGNVQNQGRMAPRLSLASAMKCKGSEDTCNHLLYSIGLALVYVQAKPG
jgi:hypothetical protein